MPSEIENLLFDLESELEEVRVSACRILAKVGDESTLEALRKATLDTSPSVRYFAGKALDAVRKRLSSAVSEEVISTQPDVSKITETEFMNLLHHQDEQMRVDAINQSVRLSKVVDKRILSSSLIAQLGREKSSFVLPSLIKNIGLIGDSSLAFILLPFLKHDIPRVRANTVEALDSLNCNDVFPHIIPLLNDPDHRVKANAAIALKACKGVDVLKIIRVMLKSSKVRMRDSAAFALGEIKTEESARMLTEIISHEEKYGICLKAVKSLEKIGAATALSLTEDLKSYVDDDRKLQMLEYLIQKFKGEDVDLQDFIDEEVSLVEESTELVVKRELSEEEQIIEKKYEEAIKILDEGNYQEAVKSFQKIVDEYPDSSWSPITRYMVDTICKEKRIVLPKSVEIEEVGEEEQEPATEDEYKEHDDVVALVEELIHDLSNPDEDVREQAVIKLTEIDDPRAIKLLTTATMDKDNVVRYFAKKALRKFQQAEEDKSFFEKEKTQAVKRSVIELVGLRNLIILGLLCIIFATGVSVKFVYSKLKIKRLFSEAEGLFFKAHHQEALSLYKSLLRLDPDNIEAYGRLADIYHAIGKFDDAVHQIKKIERLDRDSVTYQRFIGKRMLLSQKYDEALRIYNEVLVKAPKNLQTLSEVSVVLLEIGKLDEAIEKLKLLISLRSDYANAHLLLGYSNSKKENWGEAIKEFKKVIAINEKHPKVHLYLGVTYYKKAMFEEAIAEFDKALKLNPGNMDIHFNLALTYEEKELFDKAVEEYKLILEKEPENLSAHLNLGVLYGKMGNEKDEIEEYKKIREINPKYPDIYYNAGILYFNKDNIKLAMKMFKRAISCAPNYVDAYFKLGLLHHQQGNEHLAKNYYRKVLQLDPGHAKAKMFLKTLNKG